MRFTSRKLLVAIAVVALITYLLLQAEITEATWLALMDLCVKGYLTANVGQKGVEKLAEAVSAYMAKKAAGTAPAAPASSPPA